MSSDIVPVRLPDEIADKEWNVVVDSIVRELAWPDIPEKVIRATELLLTGHPVYIVAKKLGVKTDTVRLWLSQYPTMAMAVANGRALLSKWRMSKLEQQFLTAVDRSNEILDVSLTGTIDDGGAEPVDVDPKVMATIAQHARYIIGLFAGQKIDVQVTHELGDTVLEASQGALEYIAQRIAEKRDRSDVEPIEAVVRVIDPRLDNSAPLLQSNGTTHFGELGVLDRNDSGTLCHICGDRFKSFAKHLRDRHTMSAAEYELTYMLDEGEVRRSEQ